MSHTARARRVRSSPCRSLVRKHRRWLVAARNRESWSEASSSLLDQRYRQLHGASQNTKAFEPRIDREMNCSEIRLSLGSDQPSSEPSKAELAGPSQSPCSRDGETDRAFERASRCGPTLGHRQGCALGDSALSEGDRLHGTIGTSEFPWLRNLLERFDGRHSMPVLDTRDVAAQQTCLLLDVALR